MGEISVNEDVLLVVMYVFKSEKFLYYKWVEVYLFWIF